MRRFVGILLVWLLCHLSVLLHELGHALGYRISAGSAGWKVVAGSGPEILRTPKYTCRLIPVGGCFLPMEEPRTDNGKLVMLMGGPLASLLLTVLFGILRLCVFGPVQHAGGLGGILFPVSGFLLPFNFFQFFFTAVPIRYRVVCRGFESDGLQIVRVMQRKRRSPDRTERGSRPPTTDG